MGWNFGQPIGLLSCHRGVATSKKTKERTCVPTPMILSKIALVFFPTLGCKLHQKFQNDRNDVKFWMNIVNPLIFPIENKKAHILNDSHQYTLLQSMLPSFPIGSNDASSSNIYQIVPSNDLNFFYASILSMDTRSYGYILPNLFNLKK